MYQGKLFRFGKSTLLMFAWLAIVVGLPFAAHYGRPGRQDRCYFNGNRIEPDYKVRVVDAKDMDYTFCCILCAEQWLGRDSAVGHQIYVTDESSGREIEAAKAVFVRSSVVTNHVTGNRIHAFASPLDATRHAGGRGTIRSANSHPRFGHQPSSSVRSPC